jgi:polyhydroxyalkanoate synthesis regulator phasin
MLCVADLSGKEATVSESRGLFDRLKARGEEVWGQLSAELMSNERFVKAMQGALRGKEKLDEAVGTALRTMNVPTRTEFKRVLARIEALEKELAALKAARRRAKPKRSAGRTTATHRRTA